ncbi:hypothetical protein SBRCBS47491_007113 [Sporothrix bragantina]|uniref:Chromo domain-containing protein n=1 Tax=Sporothrix bragantina TaxID=671064 RepID=A0ABP0CB46_9PEZI
MPGTDIVSSPQAAPSTSNNPASPSKSTRTTKSSKSTKSAKPSKTIAKKRKPAKKTKATKKPRNEATPAPPADGENDEWFAIRDIVDEKVERGVRQYFVDWADHPVTGEVYPKSWIPATDANEEAVRHWKTVKKARKLENKAKAKTTKSAAAAQPVQTAIAESVETDSAPDRAPVLAVDSQDSFVNSSSVLTSTESRVLTPPPANSSSSSSPVQKLPRKRPAPASEKENEDSEAAPRKRRLVQGIRPELSRALEPSQSFDKNNSQSSAINTTTSQTVSQTLSQNQSQNPSQSQSQPLPSSPPATREQSFDSPASLAEVAGFLDPESETGTEPEPEPNFEVEIERSSVPTAVPVANIDITPGLGFNPNEYARFSQVAQLSQIARDSLQTHGLLSSQSAAPIHHQNPRTPHNPYYDPVYDSASRQVDEDPISSSSSVQGRATPHIASGHTIPDSQQDEDSQTLFVDRFDDDYDNDDEGFDQLAQPVVPAEEHSLLQPDTVSASNPTSHPASNSVSIATSTNGAASIDSTTSGNAQHVPQPASSQDNQQLRASAGWASQDEPPVRSSHSLSIQFLTQPDPDFTPLFTQPSHQSQPSQAGQPSANKSPVSSAATGRNNYSAVSVIPESTRPARVTELPPRPHTPSPSPYIFYQAPVAIMDESPARPLPSSAVEALQQALQAPHETTDEVGLSNVSDVDDPLVLAEIQRMQQEGPDASSTIDDPAVLAEIQRMEQQSQDATASSAEDPLVLAEIQRLQGVSSSGQALPVSQDESLSGGSNILPISLSTAPPVDPTLVLSTEPEPAPALQTVDPLLAPANTLPGNVLLGQDPTFVPGAQHIGGAIDDIGNVHPGTIAMSDLTYADPLAPPTLDLSSEPDIEAEVGQEAEVEYPLTGLGGFAAGSSNGVSDAGADVDGDENEDEEDNGLEQLSSPMAMEEDGDEHAEQVADGAEDAEDADDDDEGDLPSLSNPNFSTNSYVVTLPLAANTRQNYIDLVVDKKTQETIKDFSEVFSRDVSEVPSIEAIAQVDELLRKLLDLSDLPPFSDSLPAMTPEAMMKHAVNTNSKFSFVYEFLNDIATQDKSVLILGRKGVVLNYLEAVASASNLPVERFNASTYAQPNAGTGQRRPSFSVLLADTAEMAEAKVNAARTGKFPQPTDFDIVIGFDHTARTSGLIAYFVETSPSDVQDAQSSRYQLPKPIALLLVSALTLEQVDLRLELDSVDDLERKNALLLCTLESLTYLKDSPYDEAPAKPHQAAEAFAKMVRAPAELLDWEPTPLPEDVFDIYMHSSGPTSQPAFTQDETINGGLPCTARKRQLDDDDNNGGKGDETAKRARFQIHEATSAIVPEPTNQYSDAIKHVLAGLGVNDSGIGPAVSISLSHLEALAAKVTSLEIQLQDKESLEATLTERVHTLDRLVKGQAATINDCHVKLQTAVKDRAVFERERDAAIKDATSTKEKLETRTTALAELRTEKKDLEASLAAANAMAAGSSQLDVAELGAARVALQEAQDKMAALERKVANNSEELEFARRAYQDASNAAAEMSSENRDLTARVKELDRLAADNLLKIHQTQNRNELDAYRQQWTEAITMLGERERELEIARDELRTLKNGRRETRQSSVPRSPRLSVISPRTISGRGGSVGLGPNGGNGGSGGGGASSSASGSTPIPPSVGAGFAVAARASVSRGNSPVSATFDATIHNHGGNGGGGVAPLPGMTYLNASQGGGRFGHLRD